MLIHPLPGVLAPERCSDPRGYAGKPPREGEGGGRGGAVLHLNYAPQRCLSIKLGSSSQRNSELIGDTKVET